jgi:hypothetical protein
MKQNDFKIGLEFRFRDQTWRCTDVGTRTISAICLTETWTTRVHANTGVKEKVKLAVVDKKFFDGPPYGVSEQVLSEETFASCLPLADWQAARRLLGLG